MRTRRGWGQAVGKGEEGVTLSEGPAWSASVRMRPGFWHASAQVQVHGVSVGNWFWGQGWRRGLVGGAGPIRHDCPPSHRYLLAATNYPIFHIGPTPSAGTPSASRQNPPILCLTIQQKYDISPVFSADHSHPSAASFGSPFSVVSSLRVVETGSFRGHFRVGFYNPSKPQPLADKTLRSPSPGKSRFSAAPPIPDAMQTASIPPAHSTSFNPRPRAWNRNASLTCLSQ